MDYEKKYNEALEREEAIRRIKAWNLDADDLEVLSILIPELRESKYERVRKNIVATIEQCPDDFLSPKNRNRMLDWLEKQKEQKPTEKQDYSGLNDLERAILRGFLCADVENVPVTIIKETAQDCLAHIPADWSEEDEENIDSLIIILHKALSKGISCKEEVLDLTDWINNLRPSWKPSEELLEALHTAAYLPEMEFYGGLKDKIRELYKQLKKL